MTSEKSNETTEDQFLNQTMAALGWAPPNTPPEVKVEEIRTNSRDHKWSVVATFGFLVILVIGGVYLGAKHIEASKATQLECMKKATTVAETVGCR